MGTIFKKVMVADRLPESGNYTVFCDFDFTTQAKYYFSDITGKMEWSVSYVQYWIEEIELPSEEEVTEAYINHKGHINNPALFGANYILNKLK